MSFSDKTKTDAKQARLNQETARVVEDAGGANFVQASYMKELCKAVLKSDSSKLECMQPEIASFSKKSWNRALRLSLAFLRRYKMDTTLSTIRLEYPTTPRSTGYSKATEVDKEFEGILGHASQNAEHESM